MSPDLYVIRKFGVGYIVSNDYNLQLDMETEKRQYIKQSDNMMFRHIRNITGNKEVFNPYIVFVDCSGYHTKQDILRKLLTEGFYINNQHFCFTERSASMCRNGIIGFIDSSIKDAVDKIITMDIDMEKTVISKYTAYRGLMFSSCFMLEDKLPYIIIIDDYETTIPNQNIKYVDEEEYEWTNPETKEVVTGTKKIIKEGIQDVNISPADGAGMHAPHISKKWADGIGITRKTPCVYMLRMPYIKGLSIEVDFKKFYAEKGITHIKDIWGKEHLVSDIDCIWTKSMYKGYKYFMKNKDYSDWQNYLAKFKEYNHCLGVAKWNFRTEEEPIYTRVNYQYLQTLSINKDEMIAMAEYSKNWIHKILSGDPLYIYKFLGMHSNDTASNNKYMNAILLNPNMLQDVKVKAFLYSLLKKYINDLKIGKIWIHGCFKIAIPDMIMLMEYAGGMEVKGSLKEGEFYAYGLNREEYLIDRNPHICPSEHVILNKTNNKDIVKYLGHLENICMLNAYDITMSRLNGCDFDKICRFQQ